MLWPKNNSCKEFDNEKKFLRLENSPPPHNFSNGPSLKQQGYLACENIRFCSLFVAGFICRDKEFPPPTTSQQQVNLITQLKGNELYNCPFGFVLITSKREIWNLTNTPCCNQFWVLIPQARSRGRGRGGSSPPRNFQTWIKFCYKSGIFLLKWKLSMEAKVSKYCRSIAHGQFGIV